MRAAVLLLLALAAWAVVWLLYAFIGWAVFVLLVVGLVMLFAGAPAFESEVWKASESEPPSDPVPFP